MVAVLRRTIAYPITVSIASTGNPNGYSGIGVIGALKAAPTSTQLSVEGDPSEVIVPGKVVGDVTGSAISTAEHLPDGEVMYVNPEPGLIASGPSQLRNPTTAIRKAGGVNEVDEVATADVAVPPEAPVPVVTVGGVNPETSKIYRSHPP